MKVYEEGDEVNSLIFWPQDEVQSAYDAVDQETKDGGELYALRRFHRRMSYFMKTAFRDLGHFLGSEAVRAEYERPMLEKALADISGAPDVEAPPVPAVPIPVMKPFIDGSGVADGINSIEFYPAERVDEIFQRISRP
jgi:hypothetical protein